MKIADARVVVCCPSRNFVTLKLTTDDGVTGLGDATLNGRELAVVSYLADHVCPLLVGRAADRIEDTWQLLYKQGRERAFMVHDGDVAVIRSGYHPVVAAPGYELYYFWVLAGKGREMAPWLDPDHAWLA